MEKECFLKQCLNGKKIGNNSMSITRCVIKYIIEALDN